jgi:hypothetical protein
LKRIAAILFLFVLLFNLYGYQLVIAYLQQQNDLHLTAQLDKDAYADEDLITIKTPLALPYYSNSPDFERMDGAIQIDGVEYKYVKRRIFNDSLELLCMPNTVKQKLQNAKSDFFELSNDLQRPEGGKKASNIIKTVLLEYCETLTFYIPHSFDKAKQKYEIPATSFLSSLLTLVQEQPPETMPFLS